MSKNKKIFTLTLILFAFAFRPLVSFAAEVCCSNVLFIPGFEGSRLYKDTKGILGTTTNTLWEPNSNEDIEKMYMQYETSLSVDPTIYIKDIIKSAFGVKDIYEKFSDSMDGLVKDGTINEWLPYAYDWRKGFEYVADDDLVKASARLASTSKTGKITIIAHSNGGLVTKSLMERLQSKLAPKFVENIIYVAVPELGTPEAIVSLLHGYNQSIAGGLIMNQNEARIFSQNMEGAYGLLPTRRFFDKKPISVIKDNFLSNSVINSYLGMKDFFLNNPFSKSSSLDTNVPLVLNKYLLPLTDIIHYSIDRQTLASTIKTLSISGWGLPTSEGITYEPDIHCDKKNKKTCPISFSVKTSDSGDGTVLTQSYSGNSNTHLFFNLKKLNEDNWGNVNHANILESSDLIAKIKDTIKQENVSIDNPPSYSKYFSETEPVSEDKDLTIKVFSPVDIDIYDKNGRHTSSKKIDIRDPNFKELESNKIIGSFSRDFGGYKFMRVPYGRNYDIVLSGNDAGVFAVKAEVSQNNNIIASTTFADMPVTPLMNVDFVVGTSTESFASTTAMYIDVDGDGTTDVVNHTNEYLNSTSTDIVKDIPTYLEYMRIVIKSLKLNSQTELSWLRRIDMIEKSLSHDPTRIVDRTIKKLSSDKFKNRNLTDVQKDTILDKFNELLKNLEY